MPEVATKDRLSESGYSSSTGRPSWNLFGSEDGEDGSRRPISYPRLLPIRNRPKCRFVGDCFSTFDVVCLAFCSSRLAYSVEIDPLVQASRVAILLFLLNLVNASSTSNFTHISCKLSSRKQLPTALILRGLFSICRSSCRGIPKTAAVICRPTIPDVLPSPRLPRLQILHRGCAA